VKIIPPAALCFKTHRPKIFRGSIILAGGISEQNPKVPLIFNFKNFGEFQKLLILPEMHDLDAIFCFMQLKQHWNQIIIYKYS
jgi:hypothetical protein